MIKLVELTKVYKEGKGKSTRAVEGLNLEVKKGEICVLVGPSGCGKTTTLKMINRLIEPSGGKIYINGVDITSLDPVQLRQDIGYVIQEIGLFPHMSIAENIACVPSLKGWSKERKRKRVDELLNLVGMDSDSFRNKHPRELSGGQRQRIGVARGLGADPPILLMDEPFGAVDPLTRVKLQDEFLKIQKQLHKTVVFVTHDINEAIKMGDRVSLMREGRLIQYDTPERLLLKPKDEFVESFVGADRALKHLQLVNIQEIRLKPVAGRWSSRPKETVLEEMNLRDALSKILLTGEEEIPVANGRGKIRGLLTLEGIRGALKGIYRR